MQLDSTVYQIAAELNSCGTQQEVVDVLLDRLGQLPSVRSAWVFLRHEDHEGFELAGSVNLPEILSLPGVLAGDCNCQKNLLSGESPTGINTVKCGRLSQTRGGEGQDPEHVSIPLQDGNRGLGVLNLLGE